MPLVLDGYAEPEPEAQLEAYAREVGLLRDVEDRPCYTVMVSTLLSREGANRTTPSFAASIDRAGRQVPAQRQLLFRRQGGDGAAGQSLGF